MERRTQELQVAARDKSNVTLGLRRIRREMEHNIKKVTNISETLVQDKETINKTNTELNRYGSTLHKSHGLLSRFKIAEHLDTIILGLCFIFFVSVVFYIVYKRIRFRIPVIGWILNLD